MIKYRSRRCDIDSVELIISYLGNRPFFSCVLNQVTFNSWFRLCFTSFDLKNDVPLSCNFWSLFGMRILIEEWSLSSGNSVVNSASMRSFQLRRQLNEKPLKTVCPTVLKLDVLVIRTTKKTSNPSMKLPADHRGNRFVVHPCNWTEVGQRPITFFKEKNCIRTFSIFFMKFLKKTVQINLTWRNTSVDRQRPGSRQSSAPHCRDEFSFIGGSEST